MCALSRILNIEHHSVHAGIRSYADGGNPDVAVATLTAQRTLTVLLERTLERRTVSACVRGYFRECEARQRQAEDSGHAG
jgi:hypothetical protein